MNIDRLRNDGPMNPRLPFKFLYKMMPESDRPDGTYPFYLIYVGEASPKTEGEGRFHGYLSAFRLLARDGLRPDAFGIAKSNLIRAWNEAFTMVLGKALFNSLFATAIVGFGSAFASGAWLYGW